MQTTLSERAISMHSVAAMDDAFEKDEEYAHFNALGFQFLEAREAMEQHPLNTVEKSVLENLKRVTKLTQPLVTAIFDKALTAETAEARIEVSRLIYQDAIPNQKKIAIELGNLVKLQEDAIREGTQRAHGAYKDARKLIWGIGTAAAVLGFIVAFFAVRNATRQAQSLQRQAMFDELTSLPNRVLFQDRLQQAITVSRRENLPFSLLALDLNRFKEVNDTLGHHYGDLLLKQVAVRLIEVGRESDTIARMGGDEFSLLLPATGALGAEVFAKKIMTAMEASFDLKGKSTEMGVSIGIAEFPAQGTDYETLMRHAEMLCMWQSARVADMKCMTAKNRRSTNSTSPSKPSFAARSSKISWCCTFNPKSIIRRAKLAGSKRWYAGNILYAVLFPLIVLYPWPNKRV